MPNYKPQSPLIMNGEGIFPLTTYDQVILANGERWDGKLGVPVEFVPALTAGNEIGTLTIDGKATKLYYQGSSVTLNGTSTQNASFYAPTSAGIDGQVLKSNGSGAPSWTGLTSLLKEKDKANIWMIYDRDEVGISPNFDDPGFNGLFELRSKSETTGETGTKPYEGFGPFISIKGSNTMLQLAGTNTSGFYIRGKQSGNVTLSGCAWQQILTNENWSNYITTSSLGALPLSGGTITGSLQVNGLMLGYNYGVGGNNCAAFMLDKPGTNYTGIGGNAEQDTIYFGACDSNGVWVTSYRQKWKFNGSLIVGGGDDNCNIVPWTNNYSTIGTDSLRWWKVFAKEIRGDSVYGAVWNDYAEYRSQNENIEPGYIAYCDDDGKLKKTVKRLQKYEGVVSDTFGFAIGETDDCKTPLAVSGRALVYCDPEEEHFHSGDCVCAGPNGLAYRMTREEIIEFPDRIVGIVSEIPTYKTWGTGNVEVNGRIWIKVK